MLIGDNLFMSLSNQGKVTTALEPSLSTKQSNLDSKTISISNSKTKLIVSKIENNLTVKVYNLSGQLILTKKLSTNENSIDISSFNEGVYLLKTDNNQVFKFIK